MAPCASASRSLIPAWNFSHPGHGEEDRGPDLLEVVGQLVDRLGVEDLSAGAPGGDGELLLGDVRQRQIGEDPVLGPMPIAGIACPAVQVGLSWESITALAAQWSPTCRSGWPARPARAPRAAARDGVVDLGALAMNSSQLITSLSSMIGAPFITTTWRRWVRASRRLDLLPLVLVLHQHHRRLGEWLSTYATSSGEEVV